jgi:cardiolipin synthase
MKLLRTIKAKQRVWLETYILEAGSVADQTLQVLTDAANRGVDVKLIYDFVGSQKLKSSYLDKLKAAGTSLFIFIIHLPKEDK